MIKARIVAIVSALLGLVLATSLPAEPDVKTAAELDWVPREALDAAAAQTLPWYCNGMYVAPSFGADIAPDQIAATADTTEHVTDDYSVLTGDVVVEQRDREVRAPRITIDHKTDIATIEGPLVVREPGLVLTGAGAKFNLYDDTGTVDLATFLLHQTSLRGSADSIERLPNTDLDLDRAVFTRCNPESNVWAIGGKHIRLEQRTGFGTARDVTFRLEGVPVAWVPWIRFPIDDERHTGFLMPGIGYDSSGGTDLWAPYYFNLAPQYDATYQPRSLWKRGIIHDLQFRFLAGPSTNEINMGFIRQDDIYDDRYLIDETSDTTDTSTVDVPPFREQDRWFVNARHSGGWTSRWKSTVSYSAVSDIDYLHDIGGDVGSTTVDKFVGPIDQGLANRRSAALDRQGKIQYRGDAWNYALLIQAFQNLDPDGAEQYELLPRLSGDYANHFGPVDLDLALEYTFFDKDNTGLTGPLAIIGERAVADVGVSWRKSVIWGFVEPSLGVVHRKYSLEDTPAGTRANPEITTPRFSLDAGLFFDRFFEVGDHRLQQTLEPRAYYLYVEEDNQDDLPQFDASPSTPSYDQLFRDNRFSGKDRIGDARQISVGVTTRLLDQDTAAQFFEASLGQIYYLEDREVVFQPRPSEDPEARESPLFSQARLSLENGLNVAASLEWEPDVGRTNRSNVSIKYVSGDRKIFNLSYIYTSPEVQPASLVQNAEETDLSFIWPIKGRWSAIGRWNFSWDRHQTIESLAGFEYNDCCWKARVVIRRFLKEPRNITVLQDDPASPTGFTPVSRTVLPDDKGIFIEFQMKGLATLGRRLDLLLEDAIPGYEKREEQIGQ